jgi:hypothetical protein
MVGFPLERVCAEVCFARAGVGPSRGLAGGAIGVRLRGATPDNRDARRTGDVARSLAAGERAEPDKAVRELAAVRCRSP